MRPCNVMIELLKSPSCCHLPAALALNDLSDSVDTADPVAHGSDVLGIHQVDFVEQALIRKGQLLDCRVQFRFMKAVR